MVNEVRPGQLVSSTQGRDEGRYYLVLSKTDDGYVLVTDGEYRGVENLKKKNPKHIKIWPQTSERLAASLADQVKVTNTEILSELAMMIKAIQEVPLLKGKEVG